MQFADLNHDGDEEMVLQVSQTDGRGFLMADPLGMFDMLDKLGYGSTNVLDYWNALSRTQRGMLLSEMSGTGIDYGPTIDAARLRSFLARFQSGSTRTYPTQEYAEVIDATGYQVASCDESGTLCGVAQFANTEV